MKNSTSKMRGIISPWTEDGNAEDSQPNATEKCDTAKSSSTDAAANKPDENPTGLSENHQRKSDEIAQEINSWRFKLGHFSKGSGPSTDSVPNKAVAGPSAPVVKTVKRRRKTWTVKQNVPQEPACTRCAYRGFLNIHRMSKLCPDCNITYSCHNFFRIHLMPHCKFLERWKATGDYPPILDRLSNEYFRLPPKPQDETKIPKKKPRRPQKKDTTPQTLSCDACELTLPATKRRTFTLHFLSSTHCPKTLEILPCETSVLRHKTDCMDCSSPKKAASSGCVVCKICNESVPNREFRSHQIVRRCYKCTSARSFKCLGLLNSHLKAGQHLDKEEDEAPSPEPIIAKSPTIDDPRQENELRCSGCGREYDTAESLASHLRDKCPLCDLPVGCAALLLRHNQEVHLICMYCNRGCDSKDKMAKHQSNQRCADCSKSFKCVMALEQHHERTHTILRCSCSMKMTSKAALDAHTNVKCSKCERKFSCVTYLRRHQANSTVCNTVLQFNDALDNDEDEEVQEEERVQEEEQEQEEEQPNGVCPLCSQHAAKLSTHLQPVSCENCKEQLDCHGMLVMHRFQCQDSARSKTCTHCKLKFADSMELVKHTSHKTCPECQGSEKCATLFMKHRCEESTAKRILRCRFCNEQQGSQQQLLEHQQQGVCSCNKTLPCSSLYREHKKSCLLASGPSFIRCPICGDRFGSTKQLGNHVELTHASHDCEHCGEMCDSNEHLKSHIAKCQKRKNASNYSESGKTEDYVVKHSIGSRITFVRRGSAQDTLSPASSSAANEDDAADEEKTKAERTKGLRPEIKAQVEQKRQPDSLSLNNIVDLTADDDSDIEVIDVIVN